jgi:hypothetical protein
MGENKIDLVEAEQKDLDWIMWFTIDTSGEFF